MSLIAFFLGFFAWMIILGVVTAEEAAIPVRPTVRLSPQPVWVIPYGGEFWRADSNGSDIDLSGFIERTTHVWKHGAVAGSHYHAALHGDTLTFITKGATEARVDLQTLSTSNPAPWNFHGNVAQRLLQHPLGLVEHLEARRDGLALTWILRRRPPSDTFAIEIGVSASGYAGKSKHGHHFTDAYGTARIRFGSVVLVDRLGNRSPAAVQWDSEGDRLRIEVPAAVLATAAYPLAIDPVIGPEFEIDVPAEKIRPAKLPDVATNGQNYLVVSQQDIIMGFRITQQIWGTLLSLDGDVLDNFPIGQSDDGGSSRAIIPSVASNGRDYLVVWSDNRSQREGGFPPPADLMGMRIAGDGALLDGEGFVIADDAVGHNFVDVASDGTNYLIAWEHFPVGETFKVRSAIIAGSGEISKPPITVLGEAGTQGPPQIAFGGEHYLVVWGSGQVRGARVHPDGSVIASGAFPIGPQGQQVKFPNVGFNGTDFLVTWGNLVPPKFRLQGSLVTASGEVVHPEGILIGDEAQVFGNVSHPSAIVGAGTDFLVNWINGNELKGTVVSGTNGASSSPEGTPLSEAGVVTKVVAVPNPSGGAFVVWNDLRFASNGVDSTFLAVNLDAAGAIAEPPGEFPVILTRNSQTQPEIASNGQGFLVVWDDDRNQAVAGSDVLGFRLDAEGKLLDAEALPIGVGPGPQSFAGVASNGTDYLVVWNDNRKRVERFPGQPAFGFDDDHEIYGARVRASDGVVLEPEGFPIAEAPNQQVVPVVAGTPNGYLVVWEDRRNSPQFGFESDVYGARVSSEGVVLDPSGIPIDAQENEQANQVFAAGNGSDFLVSWIVSKSETVDNTTSNWSELLARRISPEGAILDPALLPISVARSFKSFPEIASSGGDFLVVWSDNQDNTENRDIWGARISAAGELLDPGGFVLNAGNDFETDPVVAGYDDGYMVIWADEPNPSSDINGARVGLDGTVMDPSGFDVAVGESDEFEPAITHLADGRFLVAFEQIDAFAFPRIRGIILTENGVTAPSNPVRITAIVHDERGITLTWTSNSGRSYRVRHSASMMPDGWTDLTGDVTATSASTSKTDSTVGGVLERYYQVVELP